MTAYLITYDLRKVRNYEGLLQRLKETGFFSPLESVWLGIGAQPASSVRDDFARFIDRDDGLLVVELSAGADWAFQNVNLGAKTAAWLRTNVTP